MLKNSPKSAERTAKITPFRVMTVLERASQLEAGGRSIIHMEVGEPDFVTAKPIIEAGQQALDNGHIHYTAATGIPQLKEKISQYYLQKFDVVVNVDRICVTPGASGGLSLLSHLLLNPGDGILLADPGYPCNRNFIHLAGAEPQLVPVNKESNFQPSLTLLDKFARHNTTGVWLATPANPTGTILDEKSLREITQWARARNAHVLVDEIYQGLHYLDELPTALKEDSTAFIVNSFSKYFGMTGWRLGWIIFPPEYTEIVTTLAQNLFISASSIAQFAALAAFEPATIEILEERRHQFRKRRDFLYKALIELGFCVETKTQGGLYIYAGIEQFSTDAEQFCMDMLENHGVALTPGVDFGDNACNKYVRFAFTTEMKNLQQGIDRLRQALV